MSFHKELLGQFSTRTANTLFEDREYLEVSSLEELRRCLIGEPGTVNKFVMKLLRVPGLGKKSADEVYMWANEGRSLFGPRPDLRAKRRREIAEKKAKKLRGIVSRAEEKLKAWRKELKALEREISL